MRVVGHVLSTRSEGMKTTSPVEQNMPYHSHFNLILALTSWVDQGGQKEYTSRVSPL